MKATDIDTLSFEQVSKLLKYDPQTGRLFWKERDMSFFSSSKEMKRWNSRYAGSEAFTALSYGYKRGLIFRRDYKAHRIAWLLHFHEWPEDQIDHINGDRSDNRICNLRNVNNEGNTRNAKIRHDTASGVTGVNWHKKIRKWRAYIGRQIPLGYFSEFEDAVKARREAERKFGYHENHGRSA